MLKKQIMLIISLVPVLLAVTACNNTTIEPVEVTRIVEVTAEPQVTPSPTPPPKILDLVRKRGHLICGTRDDLVGFAYLDKAGNNVGFDVDLCRAVAAAVLDDANAVEFIPLNSSERGPALLEGQIDMLARVTTWTTTRDAQWGNFTAIMFYDGQGFMVPLTSGVTKLEDLDGAIICVTSGTTTETNLVNIFDQKGLTITVKKFSDADDVYAAYEEGDCLSVTGDKSTLVSKRTTFTDPTAHLILDETISKEPLTPVVPKNDDEWFDVVKVVMFILINAEELRITSENVEAMLNSDSIEVRRLLGTEETFGQAELRLNQDVAVSIIQQVGNYGEIYERHLGSSESLNLPRGLNNLWTEEGGLIYAPPLK